MLTLALRLSVVLRSKWVVGPQDTKYSLKKTEDEGVSIAYDLVCQILGLHLLLA